MVTTEKQCPQRLKLVDSASVTARLKPCLTKTGTCSAAHSLDEKRLLHEGLYERRPGLVGCGVVAG